MISMIMYLMTVFLPRFLAFCFLAFECFLGFLVLTVKKGMETVRSIEPRLWDFWLLKGKWKQPDL